MWNRIRRTSPKARAALALATGIVVFGVMYTPAAAGTSAKATCKLAGSHYAGSSSQKQRLCLTLSSDRRKLVELAYDFRDNCGSIGTLRTTNPHRGYIAVLSGSGKFSYGDPAKYFKGVVKGGKASGTLRNSGYNPGLGTTCDTGVVKWSARSG